ncbi:MAG: NADP-dependent oxidoreductase [Pseudomonadales bacterium]
MNKTNRQWLLHSRPEGMVSEANFLLAETPLPKPDLAAGEFLVRNTYFSFEPAMRGWMEDKPSYLPPVAIGEPMRSTAIGEIVQSNNPEFPEGSLVQGMFGWQEYAIGGDASLFPANLLPADVPPTMLLSIMGGTALTAYFGLLYVGELKEGDTVLVSGAAGATGSVVAQIAKIKGCKVVGIAGGDAKCSWLTDDVGIDHTIDYKSENMKQRIGELCPEGVNVFFDNVGGDTLEAGIEHIAQFGRIVLCGAISEYNDEQPRSGPNNLMNLVKFSVRMEGFIMFNYIDKIDEAYADLGNWLAEGKLLWKEDIQEGFENIPATFLRLFSGSNEGKQLLKVI